MKTLPYLKEIPAKTDLLFSGGFKKILAIVAVWTPFAFAGVQAAPTINSVAGVISPGSVVSITGQNFGAKTAATPLVWDTLEDGACNTTATTGTWESVNDLTISASGSGHASSYAARVSFGGANKKNHGYFTGNNAQLSSKWYASYWFRLDPNFDWGTGPYGSGDANLANVKIFRLWNPGSTDENFVMALKGFDGTMIYTTENVTNDGGNSYAWNTFLSSITKGVWHRFQFEFQESGLNQNNGVIRAWLDGQQIVNNSGIKTKEDFSGDKRPFILGFYDSWDDANTDNDDFFIDDIYADGTWARVEIGNAATWNASTLREPQIPTAWSTGSISVQANTGSFTSGQTAYLYVVDAAGAVNANGYPVTIGGGTSAPEANVTGDGVTIVDGDSTPAISDGTDFGSVGVSSGTSTRTYTIQNTGTAALSVNNVAVGGTHASDFVVTAQPASSVAAGGSTTFSVRFDPSAAGTRSATLSFGNNDANENPYNFSIQGSGSTAVEVIVDNTQAVFTPDSTAWPASQFEPGYYGANYQHDGNTGKGSKSARFTPNLPAAGTYEVFARWTAGSNRANNVPIDIFTSAVAPAVTVTRDQTLNNNAWVSLGRYSFSAGSGGSVLIRTTGTNGNVIADAVRFVAVPAMAVNFSTATITGYSGGQDVSGTYQVQDAGATLNLTGNTWKKIDFAYTITANTVLEFDFKSTSQGEVHGIGLDSDNDYSTTPTNLFALYGTDSSLGRQNYHNYPGGGGWVHYIIPIGQFYTGGRNYLCFVSDKDGGTQSNTSYFRNVTVHE